MDIFQKIWIFLLKMMIRSNTFAFESIYLALNVNSLRSSQ